MSEPIKPGDLVMIVRGHWCVVKKYCGVPFVVSEIHNPRNGCYQCETCGEAPIATGEPGARGLRTCKIPLSWLKRIDPPAEPERVERDEEITV